MFKLVLSLAFCTCILCAVAAQELQSGPNHFQKAPHLKSAKVEKSNTKVSGKLHSVKDTTFLIQFFFSTRSKEGTDTFLGQITVKTDGKGKASFKALLPVVSSDSFITATATRLQSGKETDTSEYSKAVVVK